MNTMTGFLILINLLTILPAAIILAAKPRNLLLTLGLAVAVAVANYLMHFSATLTILLELLIFFAYFLLTIRLGAQDRRLSFQRAPLSLTKAFLLFTNAIIVQSFISGRFNLWLYGSGFISPRDNNFVYLAPLVSALVEMTAIAILALLELKLIQRLHQKGRTVLLALSFLGFSYYFSKRGMIDIETISGRPDVLRKVILAIALGLLLLLIVAVVYGQYAIQRELQAEKLQAEDEALRKQWELNGQSWLDARKFRHNIVNQLLPVKQFFTQYQETNSADLTQIKEYFLTEVVPEIDNDTLASGSYQRLEQIDNPTLRYLLIAKLTDLPLDQIRLVIDIPEKIHLNDQAANQLIRGLGIILDNAKEGVLAAGGGELLLAVTAETQLVTITVVNTCPPDLPPIYQLLEEGFSTKGENRGLGLSQVKADFAQAGFDHSLRIEGNHFIHVIGIPKEVQP